MEYDFLKIIKKNWVGEEGVLKSIKRFIKRINEEFLFYERLVGSCVLLGRRGRIVLWLIVWCLVR